MATVSYTSSTIDPELSKQFESALARARAGRQAPILHHIGNTESDAGESFASRDPANPATVLASAHTAGRDVVDAAVAAARGSAAGWRNTHHEERIEVMRAAADGFATREMELAGALSAETGKSRLESLAEVQESHDLIEQYCDVLEAGNGFITPMKGRNGEHNVDVLRPYGVFGVIAPFNFPIALAIGMTAAALVTGNAVVLKPSDKTPLSTELAAEIVRNALPDGVLNVVQGGPATGTALAESAIDGLAFTGSAKVGWGLIQQLSRGPRPRPVLAEMGGQNPVIVTDSADLDAAASGIVRSAYGFSGQKCSSTRRVIVARAVYDGLLERLVARTGELVVGDAALQEMNVGPLIDEVIADRVERALKSADTDGHVVTGGRERSLPGHFFRPIIVTGLPRGHRLTREELFAPFVTITAVDDFEEAIGEANAVDFGLTAGIFTTDDRQIDQFFSEAEAGVLYANRAAGATTGAWPGEQSFCGWKQSGSTGKGGLGPWYPQGFCREQNRTFVK
ncbi:1-pyrroline-5-carboxylate dehydrogenase [Antricoccus suffuscus]|uniref:1-pyrroline-5-carboxylate dehydrogenase n=1 Tax=Antricoccus suffuscus TaxID=1629062 RepID=A0A2T1A0S1_9ACTN|nr:aldehyde dehydrogenase family protein [Antricoccus suffuscus]PRZ42202.1 1-pyrroline-5-carboxylate dehydrogenase [Antricoccus suffuscus]